MSFVSDLKAAATRSLPVSRTMISPGSAVAPASNVDAATGINPYNLQGYSSLQLPSPDAQSMLENGYAGNQYVFTIVDWKATRCGEATPLVYRVKNEKAYSQYQYLVKSGRQLSYDGMVMRVKALEEVDGTDLSALLSQPNPQQTWSELAYALHVYFDFGDALLWGTRLDVGLNAGRITELYPLVPHQYGGENPSAISGFAEYVLRTDSRVRLKGADVLHMRRFNPGIGAGANTLWGMSRLSPARRLLAQSNNTGDAMAETMQNRGARTIIFPKGNSYDSMVADNPLIGQQSTDAIRKKLKQAGAGGIAGNSFELGSIMVGMSPVDLDVMKLTTTTKEDFCSLWHVDALAVFSALQGATYANAEAAIRNSLINGILPDLRLRDQKLTQYLCPGYQTKGERLVIMSDTDVYAELQANKKELAEWIDAVPLTGDERRQLFKWGVTGKPEMQVELVKSTLTPVTDFLGGGNDAEVINDGTYN